MDCGININLNAFDSVPQNRKAAIIETFGFAPDGVKSIINRLSQELNVGDTREFINSNGEIQREVCHYSPTNGEIRMNPNYDNDEYAEVFRHEYGHFVDDKCGDVSNSPEFIDALEKDKTDFLFDTSRKDQMLNDLFSCDAAYDRCVSDILSGFFENDPKIKQRYSDEFIGYWCHSNDYWSGVNGPLNAKGKETFANLFSIYSTQNRQDSIAFLEKYFPTTTSSFKMMFDLQQKGAK